MNPGDPALSRITIIDEVLTLRPKIRDLILYVIFRGHEGRRLDPTRIVAMGPTSAAGRRRDVLVVDRRFPNPPPARLAPTTL